MIFTVSLKKNQDFIRVHKSGRYYVGRYLVLHSLRIISEDANAGDGAAGVCTRKNALGVTASKKVGKSVHRNRVRRLVKENYRILEENLKRGFWLVFVVRGGVGIRKADGDGIPSFEDVGKDMRMLLLRAGILSKRD